MLKILVVAVHELFQGFHVQFVPFEKFGEQVLQRFVSGRPEPGAVPGLYLHIGDGIGRILPFFVYFVEIGKSGVSRPEFHESLFPSVFDLLERPVVFVEGVVHGFEVAQIVSPFVRTEYHGESIRVDPRAFVHDAQLFVELLRQTQVAFHRGFALSEKSHYRRYEADPGGYATHDIPERCALFPDFVHAIGELSRIGGYVNQGIQRPGQPFIEIADILYRRPRTRCDRLESGCGIRPIPVIDGFSRIFGGAFQLFEFCVEFDDFTAQFCPFLGIRHGQVVVCLACGL